MPKTSKCNHSILQLTPSPFAALAGFSPPSPRTLVAATTPSGRAPPTSAVTSSSKLLKAFQAESRAFPAPLVLPYDALNYDPDGSDEPPQSFRSWLNERCRNKITGERKTLYVGAVPQIDEKVGFMEGWTKPNLGDAGEGEEPPAKRARKGKAVAKEKVEVFESELDPPGVEDTIEYLKAFYHGMPVKRLPIPLRWTAWQQSKNRAVPSVKSIPKYVSLSYGDAATRIRARPSPDNVFPAQLNLDDILDAAITMLPADAYAMVLLVSHDIYESPEDDFCAGRAYGGSRVSVVQLARYNPLLDEKMGIKRGHAWPMSHCKCVVNELCDEEGDVDIPRPTAVEVRLSKIGAMREAVDAVAKLKAGDSKAEIESLWASRVLRTVSHELGYVPSLSMQWSITARLHVLVSQHHLIYLVHYVAPISNLLPLTSPRHTLCLAHCPYYACIMQSTSSLLEDTRQPPFLCPVCLTKISHAISSELLHRTSASDYQRWQHDRYVALKTFCAAQTTPTFLWIALEAWLGSALEEDEFEVQERLGEILNLSGDSPL